MLEHRKNEVCEGLGESGPKLGFHSSLRLGSSFLGPRKDNQSLSLRYPVVSRQDKMFYKRLAKKVLKPESQQRNLIWEVVGGLLHPIW